MSVPRDFSDRLGEVMRVYGGRGVLPEGAGLAATGASTDLVYNLYIQDR